MFCPNMDTFYMLKTVHVAAIGTKQCPENATVFQCSHYKCSGQSSIGLSQHCPQSIFAKGTIQWRHSLAGVGRIKALYARSFS